MTQPSNIAVLGAGIMGLCSAHALSEAGHHVTLYDPNGFPAENASAMAGGMLAPYSEIEHMPKHWIDAGLSGIEFWQNFSKDHDIDFHQNGSVFVAHKDDRYILERFRSHLEKTAPDSFETTDIQSLEPKLDERFKEGLFLKAEAHLNPAQTMQTLIETLKKQSVSFANSAMLPEECSADWVIDCRGMTSSSEENELRGIKGETLIARNPEFTLSRPVRLMHPRYPLYIIPRGDDVFMIGATVIESEDNEHVSLRSSMELMSALYALSPSFGEAEIVSLKAGIRPSYPDNLPRITCQDNIIRCNGLFRHGYLLAPAMAACTADYINDKDHEYMPLFNKGQSNEADRQRAA